MTTTIDEAQLRKELSVPRHATLHDILDLIRSEGYTPKLTAMRIGGRREYTCHLRNGVFSTTSQYSHRDEKKFTSPELAAIHALRHARQLSRQTPQRR